jgi:ABC-type sugar transport system permease subunit
VSSRSADRRLAWVLLVPMLTVLALMALGPLAWTAWESLHLHDLRMPWRGRPFIGLDNYIELLSTERFRDALGHTVFFTIVSVTLELGLGLALALGLDRAFRGRGLARAAALLPWAIPTVVAGLLWRFVFESWLVSPALAWVPVIVADVWKSTPFVALLLLAGLQAIDPAVHEAAAVDGAGRWHRLRYVTLPLLRPAIAVAVVFRSLDAFRVFDLVYVTTGGGPGTATEPLALYAFAVLLQHLRFGYGAALSIAIFAVTALIAAASLRLLRTDRTHGAAGGGG